MSDPVLMRVRDFAEAEGLGRDATYRLIAEGRIRAVRVNRKILIPRSELTAIPEREMGGARGD